MQQHITTDEVEVLDRIMYLLEEGSVSYLVYEDNNFAHFVDQLYSAVQDKAVQLRATT